MRSSHDNLSADGYRVLVAPDRAKALALLATAHPDLIVVDVNGQTLELLDAVRVRRGDRRRADPDTPMIVLSRDADRLQRIRLLERGGDDVVRKPFAYPELRARIARGAAPLADDRRGRRILRAGPIVIDVRSREVRVCERPVELSANEYELLLALAGEPHRVFTREELLRSRLGLSDVRPHQDARQPRARGCGASCATGGDDRLVINVWGVGYRLCDAVSASMSDGATPRKRRRALPAARVPSAPGRRGRRSRSEAQRRAAVRDQRDRARGRRGRAAARRGHVHRARRAAARACSPSRPGALLAVAARFEEAADLSRARQIDSEGEEP